MTSATHAASVCPPPTAFGGAGNDSITAVCSFRPMCVYTPIVSRISLYRASVWAVRGRTPARSNEVMKVCR